MRVKHITHQTEAKSDLDQQHIDYLHDIWRKKNNISHKLKEDGPTNSMGASSAISGPVQTFDPLLPVHMARRKNFQRFSKFLKGLKKS